MKENLFNLARVCMIAMAIVQLTLSQIHIAVIMKVFADEIGFYLFLFIIFGLVVAFNSINLKGNKGIFLDVLGVLAATLAGYKYISILMEDLAMGNVLTMKEASVSLNLSIATLVVYIVGMVIILMTRGKREPDESYE